MKTKSIKTEHLIQIVLVEISLMCLLFSTVGMSDNETIIYTHFGIIIPLAFTIPLLCTRIFNSANEWIHPELKDGEIFIVNIKDGETWIIPDFITNVREGTVAYENGMVLPDMKPLFGKLVHTEAKGSW